MSRSYVGGNALLNTVYHISEHLGRLSSWEKVPMHHGLFYWLHNCCVLSTNVSNFNHVSLLFILCSDARNSVPSTHVDCKRKKYVTETLRYLSWAFKILGQRSLGHVCWHLISFPCAVIMFVPIVSKCWSMSAVYVHRQNRGDKWFKMRSEIAVQLERSRRKDVLKNNWGKVSDEFPIYTTNSLYLQGCFIMCTYGVTVNSTL